MPSAHSHPFMSPFRFSFRNINDAAASTICLLVSLVSSTGEKVSRACSCVIYFITVDSPRLLNFFIPVFSACCGMTIWSMWLSFSSSSMSIFRCIYLMSWFLIAVVGISLVIFFLSLVGYIPECYVSSSYSYMTSSQLLSSAFLYIRIGYGMSSSSGSTSLTFSFLSAYSSSSSSSVSYSGVGSGSASVVGCVRLISKMGWWRHCRHTLLWYL